MPPSWVEEITIDGIGKFDNIVDGGIAEVYPNPASAITCVPIIMSEPLEVLVVMRDALGRTIEVIHERLLQSGKTKLFFNASSLPSGVYLINLEVNKVNVAGKKIMVP